MTKHWTQLQAEDAEQTPLWARPYCWKHRVYMTWQGCWMCLACHENMSKVPAYAPPPEKESV